MDRRSKEDGQALARIAASLLALAALALAAGALPASGRMLLFAVLRHAADVACAFAGKLHAPLDRHMRKPQSCKGGIELA